VPERLYMLIEKSKSKFDIWGFGVTPEKGCKTHDSQMLSYSICKEVMDESTSIINNFTISSGHVVLTSIGEEDCCIEIMDNFPKGKFTAYIRNDGDSETTFIPFKDFRGDTVRFHLSLTTIRVPGDGIIDTNFVEVPILSVLNLPLYLTDKSVWTKYKATLYSRKNQIPDNIIKRLNIQKPGHTLIMPLDFGSANQPNHVGKQIFSFAYVGISTDGEPVYLWISRHIA